MTDTVITITGNLGWDPTRKVLASGTVVTDFRVATTPRRFDKAANEWRDLETMWFTVTCWRALADNVASSLRRGDRVVVTGRLSLRTWVGKEGEQRTTHEVDATAVGFELTRGPVVAVRPERVRPTEQPADDEWTAPPADLDKADLDKVDPDTGGLLATVPEQPAA